MEELIQQAPLHARMAAEESQGRAASGPKKGGWISRWFACGQRPSRARSRSEAVGAGQCSSLGTHPFFLPPPFERDFKVGTFEHFDYNHNAEAHKASYNYNAAAHVLTEELERIQMMGEDVRAPLLHAPLASELPIPLQPTQAEVAAPSHFVLFVPLQRARQEASALSRLPCEGPPPRILSPGRSSAAKSWPRVAGESVQGEKSTTSAQKALKDNSRLSSPRSSRSSWQRADRKALTTSGRCVRKEVKLVPTPSQQPPATRLREARSVIAEMFAPSPGGVS